MEKGDIVLFELYAKDGKEWGDSILLFIQCAWMDILHYLSIINGLKLRNDHLNGPSAKFCMYLDDTLLHNAYKLKGTSSCSFREVGVLWVRQGIFASWCAEWELYESLLTEMINWLLFFPKQTKWTVWVRIVATTLFTLVSVVSGAIIESMNHGCERPLGVLLCEALSAALSPYRRRIDSSVCVADTYVHSVPHYATLWKKIAACTLFIVCFLILAASAIVPTLSLDEYRQCVDEWLGFDPSRYNGLGSWRPLLLHSYTSTWPFTWCCSSTTWVFVPISTVWMWRSWGNIWLTRAFFLSCIL